jgi:hypothetical protein
MIIAALALALLQTEASRRLDNPVHPCRYRPKSGICSVVINDYHHGRVLRPVPPHGLWPQGYICKTLHGSKIQLVFAHGLGMDDGGSQVRPWFITSQGIHCLDQHISCPITIRMHLHLDICCIADLPGRLAEGSNAAKDIPGMPIKLRRYFQIPSSMAHAIPGH